MPTLTRSGLWQETSSIGDNKKASSARLFGFGTFENQVLVGQSSRKQQRGREGENERHPKKGLNQACCKSVCMS